MQYISYNHTDHPREMSGAGPSSPHTQPHPHAAGRQVHSLVHVAVPPGYSRKRWTKVQLPGPEAATDHGVGGVRVPSRAPGTTICGRGGGISLGGRPSTCMTSSTGLKRMPNSLSSRLSRLGRPPEEVCSCDPLGPGVEAQVDATGSVG